ncbi:MAG: GNAT family N-acetyltransferase [Spirochaetaceae bacterium]
MNIEIVNKKPAVNDFRVLRVSVGWPIPSESEIETGLNNSTYIVIAIDNNKTVGMCRLVGDSSFMFLIADLIVLPSYQGKGIGKKLMEDVISHLKVNYSSVSAISLMSAKGKEGFYEKLGFISRPTDIYGCGMMLEI